MIKEFKNECEDIIKFLHDDLSTLRTGRANPALIENIEVSAYEGSSSALKQLGNINITDARCLTVQPWEKSIAGQIEKALVSANLGLQILNEGGLVRVILPELTEERRKEYVKVLKKKLEDARIKLRAHRDKTKDEIVKKEKDKEITKDDKYSYVKELDEATKEYNNKIEDMGKNKEEEIMTV